jgi:cyclase
MLITSVDREGTRQGFDVTLMEEVRQRVRIPVIACGGAGCAEDVADLLARAAADAVCCASIFHYGVCPLPALKQALARAEIAVRP